MAHAAENREICTLYNVQQQQQRSCKYKCKGCFEINKTGNNKLMKKTNKLGSILDFTFPGDDAK